MKKVRVYKTVFKVKLGKYLLLLQVRMEYDKETKVWKSA